MFVPVYVGGLIGYLCENRFGAATEVHHMDKEELNGMGCISQGLHVLQGGCQQVHHPCEDTLHQRAFPLLMCCYTR